ncbi:MAG: Holliday junction resolvase RuvX [Actinobacteria bacterium]|nr:MAG: Holliday junction resolvase RuvX [Actinomycetota bacterium]
MSERILGLDPGERRIGVAVSDATCTIASPVEFVDRQTRDHEQRLIDLCSEWEIVEIVVGFPMSLDGTEGPAATRAREFGESVKRLTGLPVAFQDERFTTVTAERALLEGGVRRRSRRNKRDQVAAAVMLQAFLDRRRHELGNEHDTNTER